MADGSPITLLRTETDQSSLVSYFTKYASKACAPKEACDTVPEVIILGG